MTVVFFPPSFCCFKALPTFPCHFCDKGNFYNSLSVGSPIKSSQMRLQREQATLHQHSQIHDNKRLIIPFSFLKTETLPLQIRMIFLDHILMLTLFFCKTRQINLISDLLFYQHCNLTVVHPGIYSGLLMLSFLDHVYKPYLHFSVTYFIKSFFVVKIQV